MDQVALENALQDFIVNLAGMDFNGVHGAGAAPGGAQFHFVNPGGPGGGFQLHGNPGDYAWGRGGLDAIITQLLNHMDGTGPPPMDKENIAGIPTVELTAEQKEKNSNCSVCWEDFAEGESVKQLECEHCFHGPCIVPWLELHGTCPVCRKELGRPIAGGTHGGVSLGGGDTTSSSGTEDEAVGGAATDEIGPSDEPHRRASVTVTAGAGGLTGFIQSALNQVFASPWTSQQNEGTTSSRSTPTSPTSTPTPSTQTTAPTSSASSSTAPPRGSSHSQSSEDPDTPAARRPRLDSEFVDLDFD